MLENTDFGKFIDVSHRELSALKYRSNVIANNIANINTPNFKRSTVNFESHLKEALDSEKEIPSFRAAKTNSAHMDFSRPIDYRGVSPRRFLDWQSQVLNNGNNVSIEQETNDAILNQMTYQLLTRSIADAYKRINIVLKG